LAWGINNRLPRLLPFGAISRRGWKRDWFSPPVSRRTWLVDSLTGCLLFGRLPGCLRAESFSANLSHSQLRRKPGVMRSG
jgi:hypothetical protein